MISFISVRPEVVSQKRWASDELFECNLVALVPRNFRDHVEHLFVNICVIFQNHSVYYDWGFVCHQPTNDELSARNAESCTGSDPFYQSMHHSTLGLILFSLGFGHCILNPGQLMYMVDRISGSCSKMTFSNCSCSLGASLSLLTSILTSSVIVLYELLVDLLPPNMQKSGSLWCTVNLQVTKFGISLLWHSRSMWSLPKSLIIWLFPECFFFFRWPHWCRRCF